METRKNFGILGKPNQKQQNRITGDMKLLVREAYKHEETSQMMPGAKDKVNLGSKVYA